jgi:transposase
VLNIATTNDAQVLKQVALLQEQEINRLRSKLKEQARELLTLKGLTPAELQLRLEKIELELLARNKALFGASSEKRPSAHEGEEKKEKAPRRGHGPKEQKQLELVEQEHALEKGAHCESCNKPLSEWEGQTDDSEEITLVERRFVIVKHKRKKYKCECPKRITMAPAEPRLVPGGRYSTKFAVEVAAAKYLDHLPLERQVAIMAREELDTDSQTLWDQVWALAQCLRPTYEALLGHVLSAPVIFADETTWRLLRMRKEDPKPPKHYAWAVASADAVFMRFVGSRSGAIAEELLGSYSGTVMADGYDVYDSRAKARETGPPLKVAHCWAHVRRKFIECEPKFEPECAVILDLIRDLYAVERELPSIFEPTTGGAEELLAVRKHLRQSESKKIIAKIKGWAKEAAAGCLPESALRKAIEYMNELWGGLTLFLENPNLPLDNNHAERALRPICVGRKNHQGSRSARGLEAAAIFYTLFGSAKLSRVEPKGYVLEAARRALAGAPVLLPHDMKA